MGRIIPDGDGALDGDDLMFAGRVARLDPDAPVLVRDGRLWAALPFGALAARDLASDLEAGVYRAADLAAGRFDARTDLAWRSQLPRDEREVIETIPADEIVTMSRQAGEALQQRRGQSVGDRRLRDAMLDHVVIRVDHAGREYPVQFRLVAALMRMGFLGEDPVRVLRAGSRIGLAATYGVVWERERGLPLL